MARPRFATIDSLRGFLLAMMTFNHLPGPHRDYTYDSIGYFTVAEGFVFISGLIAGLHGYSLLCTQGEAAMRGVFYRRTRTLYIAQLVLLVVLLAVASIVFSLNQTSLSTRHPHWSGYASAWENSLHPLFIDPILASGAAMTLLYQPPLFDVLPMYCLFIFFVPFCLCWIHRGRTLVLLGCSFFLWLAAQSHGMSVLLAEFPNRWYIHEFVFDPLAWQLLFVVGTVVGSSWVKYNWNWRPTNAMIVCAFMAVGMGFFLRYAPVDLDWKIFLGNITYRGTLAPLRLLSTAAILTTVGFCALRFPALFTWEPFARLGRNSLYIFLYQIALVYLVAYWCDDMLCKPQGLYLELIFAAICTASLWGAAAFFDQIKSLNRTHPEVLNRKLNLFGLNKGSLATGN